MANTPTQKGTAYLLGFGSLAYTGFLVEDGAEESKPVGNTIKLTDMDGATVNVTTYDQAHTFKASFKILSAGGSLVPPVESTNITLTPPGGTSKTWRQNSPVVVKTSREFAIWTVDLIDEDSMTYT